MSSPKFTVSVRSLFICFAFSLGFIAIVKAQPKSTIHLSLLDSGSVFRNPPFKNCHAVTLVALGKDTLLYAWFGGDYEGAQNVAIWGCFRYLNQVNQWGELHILAAGIENKIQQACWNPVLFKTREGVLVLDYKVGPNPREWHACRQISVDNGITWQAPIRLAQPFLGPIKNKPIQLSNGDILMPSSTESITGNRWKVHLEKTNDKGEQWEYLQLPDDTFEVIQPCLLAYGKDTLQMLCRSRHNRIISYWSFNAGKSWQPPVITSLMNPNSGIDGVTLKGGYQLLVYNPMEAGRDWWNGRARFSVAISGDGLQWKNIFDAENHETGEYSYPAIIQDASGIIHLAYTSNRTGIKFIDFSIK